MPVEVVKSVDGRRLGWSWRCLECGYHGHPLASEGTAVEALVSGWGTPECDRREQVK